jgi:transcriptional regulator with XRE-family HTH domain
LAILATMGKVMNMAKREKNISDELRAAMRQAGRAGITRYVISKRTGISQSLLSRFATGKGGIQLKTAGEIAGAIGRRLMLT